LNKKYLIIVGIIVIQLVAIGSYGYTKFVYPEIQLDENTKVSDTNDNSDSSSSSESSSSDSSSSSSEIFNDGFRDGVNDAHDGKSARYTYDNVNSWDNNDYQQGYADGYASYGKNPHLYQDLIR